jgi:phosphoribosylformylglycinamidine synthase
VEQRIGPVFRADGDVIGIIGEIVPGLAGSTYVEHAGAAPDDRAPRVDLVHETRLHRFFADVVMRGLLRSAQDVSGGGLAVALAECCLWAGLGADMQLPVGSAPAAELFGEGPGRVVVSVEPDRWPELESLAAEHRLPLLRIGVVGGERFRIRLHGEGATGAAEGRGASVADEVDEPLTVLRHAWDMGLPRALGKET